MALSTEGFEDNAPAVPEESEAESPSSGSKDSPGTLLAEIDEDAPEAPTIEDEDVSDDAPEDAEQDQQESDDGETDQEAVDYSSLQLGDGDYLSQEALDSVAEFAKEHDLPLETAQALQAEREADAQSISDGWAARVSDWGDQLKSHPELGGDNLPRTLQRARAAITEFGPPGFLDMLHASGFGNSPELMHMFNKVGEKLLEPDGFVRGGELAPQRGSAWNTWFENSGDDPSGREQAVDVDVL